MFDTLFDPLFDTLLELPDPAHTPQGHVSVLPPLEQATPHSPAQNARKHGILASVMLSSELKDYRTHLEGLLEHYVPVGYLEGQLLERIASALWRLRKLERWEAAQTAAHQQRTVTEGRRSRLTQQLKLGQSLEGVCADDLRYPCERSAQALALHRLGPEALSTRPGPDLLCWLLELRYLCPPDTRRGRAFQKIERDLERTLKSAGYSDPEGLGWIGADDFMTWPLALDKAQRYTALSGQGGPLLEDWEGHTALLEEQHAGHLERLQHLERTEAYTLAYAGLLPGPSLDKVSKYEAHLTRTLYKALHELEALQDRRMGKGAPLARLEVHGRD